MCVEHGVTVVVPTLKMMDAGTMAFVTDPIGAMFALWQADKHIGASLPNEPDTFSWNELATRDVERAMEFYKNVFGWTYEQNGDSPGTYCIAHNEDKMAAGLMQMTDDWPAEIPPYWSVYFSVDNADDAAARIKAQGGSARVEPFDIPIGRIAVMCDAQGGGFCLFQSKTG